ncbi:MAG: hypothetical protein JW712_02795 [Dehalococcoidales bacterium]|nr:hypothetical protein [Dehalococcoidales bacterium]
MLQTELLEGLGSMLKRKSRSIEGDIRELAWLWEEAIREARFGDPKLAFAVLRSLVRSYLRGHGLKMGNRRGVRKHLPIESTVMILTVNRVSDQAVFESLHQAGVTSLESFTVLLQAYQDGRYDASLVFQQGEKSETK